MSKNKNSQQSINTKLKVMKDLDVYLMIRAKRSGDTVLAQFKVLIVQFQQQTHVSEKAIFFIKKIIFEYIIATEISYLLLFAKIISTHVITQKIASLLPHDTFHLFKIIIMELRGAQVINNDSLFAHDL